MGTAGSELGYATSVFEGDSGRQAIILPGGGYTVDMPVLWYAAAALNYLGWTCIRVTWPDTMSRQLVAPIATELVSTVRAQHPDARTVLVGKSLGTMSLPVAVDLDLPGIWLTPVLVEPRIGAMARGLDSRHLLVGGTADPYWDRPVLEDTDASVTEIPDADHSLEVPGDLDATMAAITTMARAVSSFAATL